MKLVIFGATGTLGRVVVERALERGHEVTAFGRSVAPDSSRGANYVAMRGNVFDTSAVSDAIAGQDAVICTLGAGRLGGIRAAGTRNIIAAMNDRKVSRFICQSTLGAGDSAGNLNFLWKYVMFGLLLRPALADHQEQERLVRASPLDWTIVRPAAFTDGPATGQYRHGFPGTSPKGLALKISRADIAEFMLDQLESDTYIRRCPGLSYAYASQAELGRVNPVDSGDLARNRQTGY